MRSYQIPVKEFLIEDPPDYSDVLIPTPVPILTKKVAWLKEKFNHYIKEYFRKSRRRKKPLSILMYKFKLMMLMMLRWYPIAKIQCYPVATALMALHWEDLCRLSPSTTVSLLSSSKLTKANQKLWRRSLERSRRSQVCLQDLQFLITSFNHQEYLLSQDLLYHESNPKPHPQTSHFCFHYLMSFNIFLSLGLHLLSLSTPGN